MKKKTWFIMNPYMMFLAIGFLTMLTAASMYITYLVTDGFMLPFIQVVADENSLGAIAFFYSLTLITAILFCANGFEYFGIVNIKDTGIVFHALFHRKRVFLYKDLQEFGIDYGWLTIDKKYWIYFCKIPLGSKYRHRINRMPFKKYYMRIEYTEKVYQALYDAAPKEIKKQWERHYNGIRAAGYDKKKPIRIM